MTTDLLPPPGEFKTTEEIRDAKYADELRAQRKRWLVWSAPLLAIAFLAALKLLSAVVINMAGTSAYEDANHNTAATRFESLEVFNVVQPWKAHFNKGTAIYASGRFFAATQQLDIALELVPKSPAGEPPGEDECSVRTNNSLALEGLGDEALAASDPAMASNYYDQAQEMLSNCGESGGNGGEEAQEAESRQQESQGEAEQQQGEGGGEGGEDPTDGSSGGESATPSESGSSGESSSPSESGSGGESSSPSESGSGGESASPTESTDPQQSELESRNGSAQQSADADEQASGGGNGSGQNW